MQQIGEYVIPADRESVWEKLNDPTVLGACIPGCQSIEAIDDTQFKAGVKAKVGPVSALFNVQFELQDVVEPESYTIVGDVKGGAAGFGKGQAAVQLEVQDTQQTRLSYTVDAKVGGKLAQVGSRLIDGAARKMADEFFAAFAGQFGELASEVQEEGQPERYEKGGQWAVWLVAFGVLVLAMILAF